MFTPRDLTNETVAFAGEFIGTFLFLFFGFAGAQTVNHAAAQNATAGSENKPNVDNLMFISLIFGLSLMVNVWIFFRISGGMFNPAVTMALYLVGAFPILRAIVVIAAQMVAGITAAAVVKFLIPNGREMKFTVGLGGGTSVVRGLFMEMFFTTQLIFTILMLAAEKSKTTFIAPIGIGFALFIGHLGGVFFTGAGINPTRAFGPAVVAGHFPGYHWIYWLGPVMGSLLAVAIYKLFKILHYETTNGDADKSAYEADILETFYERNAKKANDLLDETTKRASVLWGRTANTATSLYGRKKGSSPILTGDFKRRPSTRSGVGSSHSPPRYQPASDFSAYAPTSPSRPKTPIPPVPPTPSNYRSNRFEPISERTSAAPSIKTYTSSIKKYPTITISDHNPNASQGRISPTYDNSYSPSNSSPTTNYQPRPPLPTTALFSQQQTSRALIPSPQQTQIQEHYHGHNDPESFNEIPIGIANYESDGNESEGEQILEHEREQQGIDRVFPLRYPIPSPAGSGGNREVLRHPRVERVRREEFYGMGI